MMEGTCSHLGKMADKEDDDEEEDEEEDKESTSTDRTKKARKQQQQQQQQSERTGAFCLWLPSSPSRHYYHNHNRVTESPSEVEKEEMNQLTCSETIHNHDDDDHDDNQDEEGEDGESVRDGESETKVSESRLTTSSSSNVPNNRKATFLETTTTGKSCTAQEFGTSTTLSNDKPLLSHCESWNTTMQPPPPPPVRHYDAAAAPPSRSNGSPLLSRKNEQKKAISSSSDGDNDKDGLLILLQCHEEIFERRQPQQRRQTNITPTAEHQEKEKVVIVENDENDNENDHEHVTTTGCRQHDHNLEKKNKKEEEEKDNDVDDVVDRKSATLNTETTAPPRQQHAGSMGMTCDDNHHDSDDDDDMMLKCNEDIGGMHHDVVVLVAAHDDDMNNNLVRGEHDNDAIDDRDTKDEENKRGEHDVALGRRPHVTNEQDRSTATPNVTDSSPSSLPPPPPAALESSPSMAHTNCLASSPSATKTLTMTPTPPPSSSSPLSKKAKTPGSNQPITSNNTNNTATTNTSDLNQETLDHLLSYLRTYDPRNHLDEDAVGVRMFHESNAAHERRKKEKMRRRRRRDDIMRDGPDAFVSSLSLCSLSSSSSSSSSMLSSSDDDDEEEDGLDGDGEVAGNGGYGEADCCDNDIDDDSDGMSEGDSSEEEGGGADGGNDGKMKKRRRRKRRKKKKTSVKVDDKFFKEVISSARERVVGATSSATDSSVVMTAAAGATATSTVTATVTEQRRADASPATSTNETRVGVGVGDSGDELGKKVSAPPSPPPQPPPSTIFDKKTLNALRKALGLAGHHHHYHHHQHLHRSRRYAGDKQTQENQSEHHDGEGEHNMDEGNGGTMGSAVTDTPRRVTRRMVRNTRIRRREERTERENRGIDALLFAVGELEKDERFSAAASVQSSELMDGEALKGGEEIESKEKHDSTGIVGIVDEDDGGNKLENGSKTRSPQRRKSPLSLPVDHKATNDVKKDAGSDILIKSDGVEKTEKIKSDNITAKSSPKKSSKITKKGKTKKKVFKQKESGTDNGTLDVGEMSSATPDETTVSDVGKGPLGITIRQDLVALVPSSIMEQRKKQQQQQRKERRGSRETTDNSSKKQEANGDTSPSAVRAIRIVLTGQNIFDYASDDDGGGGGESLLSSTDGKNSKKRKTQDQMTIPPQSKKMRVEDAPGVIPENGIIKNNSVSKISGQIKSSPKKPKLPTKAKGARASKKFVLAPSTPTKRRRALPKSPMKSSVGFEPNQTSRDILDGPLFGEIDKSYIADPEAYIFSGNFAEHPVSLSLLDWRRRQQWTPKSKKSRGPSLPAVDEERELTTPSMKWKWNAMMPAALAAVGVDVGLPSWEEISPNPDIPKQPSSLEPPRRRHSDLTYAKWCTKLINCLNGSGRSMAHHEFFYSDIDRAWFNLNEYRVDLAKMGISPTAKLTRTEWSLIRRRIRKRPRRFSKRFIQSQLMRLNHYREWVRKIQRSNDLEAVLNFGYEVPAPIKIGATVTAFNKKARILHRGIVLAHDAVRNGYLIQFERKELGYEFCPDTEVASHGVPDIILPATDVAMDGLYLGSFADPNSRPGTLPYGTTYGPLVDFHKLENEKALFHLTNVSLGQRSIVRALNAELTPETNSTSMENGFDAISAERNKKTTPETPDLSSPANRALQDPLARHQAIMIEKVAEREALVKLMTMLNAATERKAMLLKAIEGFHRIMSSYLKEGVKSAVGNCSPNWKGSFPNAQDVPSLRPFREHYTWLHANLLLTNQALEAALVHLQVMYSKAYTGRSYKLKQEEERQRILSIENRIREKSNAFLRGSNVWKTWTRALYDKSLSVGNELAAKVKLSSFTEPGKRASGGEAGNVNSFEDPERLRFLTSRTASATSVLLTTQYCRDSVIEPWSNVGRTPASACQGKKPLICAGAIGEVLQSETKRLQPTAIPGIEADRLNLDAYRVDGFKDLEQAVSTLHAEFAALIADMS